MEQNLAEFPLLSHVMLAIKFIIFLKEDPQSFTDFKLQETESTPDF